jgi:2-hydroxy-3-oxopropionate reductase
MQKIGYIGLGIMGKSIARNILKAGYPLVVLDRNRSAMDDLVMEGAQPATNPREVANMTEIIFTSLPDSADVEEVVLGENGIIEGIRPGCIFVDNSSIKPATSRKLAVALEKNGVASLDAPVSGGDTGARDGTLTIMIGGPKEVFEKVLPLFQVTGRTITHIGDAGTGQIAKIANQLMVAAQMVALGELLILIQKSGTDPAKVVQAIRGGAAQCWALDVKPQRLLIGNREPGFKASLHAKDLNIILETAREYGVPLPMTAVNAQLFNAMVAMGLGNLDNSAIISVIEELAGTELKIQA